MTTQVTFYRMIHFICFLLHSASCVFAFFSIVQNDFAQTDIYYFKYNFNYSHQERMVYETVGTANAITWVAISEGFSAVAHLFGVCISHDQYPVLSSMRRWIFSSLTISLSSCAIVMSLGTTNVFLLIFLFAANFVVQLFSFVLDYIKVKTERTPNSARLWIFLFIGLVLVTPQIVYVAWSSSEAIGMGGHTFLNLTALGLIYTFFYLASAFMQLLSLTDCCGDYFDFEIIFISLSVVSKLIISWTLVGIIHSNFEYLDCPLTLNG